MSFSTDTAKKAFNMFVNWIPLGVQISILFGKFSYDSMCAK